MNLRAAPLCLAILASTSVSGWSLGTRIPDQNADATARGGAFAATADNPSAIYYNPAGITQLNGTRVEIGAYAISLQADVSLDGGARRDFSSTNTELQIAPQAYLTWKSEKAPIALGFGVYAPFGFAIEYPDDTPIRALARRGKIEYATASPVMALQVSRSLSIAIGATVNYGKAQLENGVLAEGDQFRFKGDGVAYGFNAGVMWAPHRQHQFGLTYRSATSLTFVGDTRLQYDGFDVPTPFGPFPVPGERRRERAEAEFEFPQTITFGYSFRPTADWNLEFNLDWADWDALNTVTLRQKSGDILLPFNWRSSFMYQFGVTRKLPYGLHASLGYIYSENSVPNESFNPIVPDSDRHIFSGGVGQSFDHFSWQVAYQYAHGPERTISNGTAANGRYEFDAHAVTISLGYRF